MSFSPEQLKTARDLARAMGFEITHTHDDIAFASHNRFILLAKPEEDTLVAVVNLENSPSESAALQADLLREAAAVGARLRLGGRYRLRQETGEQLKLEFYEP